MVAISFISFLLALYVFSKGGINNSEDNANFNLFRWLNTWNPVINLNFFLIGFGLRKEYLYILKSKLILWTLLVTCILFDLFIGNLLVLQQIAIYSIFVICLTNKFPDCKMLKYSISFIGKRTYGIFFGHFYVYGRAEDLLNGFGNTSSFFIKLLEFLIILAISVGIGAITWRLIELPGMKLGEKFYSRLSKQN
jgi:peptidoglycan/LPS O-acetylase OafA/YrhL